jgi:hypothetical protein
MVPWLGSSGSTNVKLSSSYLTPVSYCSTTGVLEGWFGAHLNFI